MKISNITPHGMAEWIMALGIAFSLALFFGAFFADDPWQDHSYDIAAPIIAGTPAPHFDGREKMTCSTCHAIIKSTAVATPGLLLPILKGAPSPHIDARNEQPCTNCHTIVSKLRRDPAPPPPATLTANTGVTSLARAVTVAMTTTPPPAVSLGGEAHENFMPYRFQGKVLRVVDTVPQGTKDLYILLDNGVHQPSWIALGPVWYLRSGGCLVRSGMFVKGTAFRDATATATALAYGKSITVNGAVCGLRDSHMTGFWEQTDANDPEEK